MQSSLMKGPVGPAGVVVDGAGGELFAGADWPRRSTVARGGGGAGDDLVDAAHARRATDDAVIALGSLASDALV